MIEIFSIQDKRDAIKYICGEKVSKCWLFSVPLKFNYNLVTYGFCWDTHTAISFEKETKLTKKKIQ